jgi:hypothetical protein
MHVLGCFSALMLLGLLAPVGALAADPAARRGFEFSVERIVVEGAGGFVDEFDDGCRTCQPTSALRDLFGSKSTEVGGGLSLSWADGAARIGTPLQREMAGMPLSDSVFTASFRPELPQTLGEGYGIFLWQPASVAGERDNGVLFGVFSFPDAGDRAFLPEACRDAQLVVLARAMYFGVEDYSVDCEPLESSSLGAEVVVRADLGTQPATLSYSLDGVDFTNFAGANWPTWVIPELIGVFAQGESPASFVGLASGAQIERAPDESIQAIEGDLSSAGSLAAGPFRPISASSGTFRIESVPGSDVRVAAASLVLTTGSGALSASPVGSYGTREVDEQSGRPISGPNGVSFGSERAFDALCDWTEPIDPWDRLTCGLKRFNSAIALPPFAFPPIYNPRTSEAGTLSSLYSNLLAGNPSAKTFAINFLSEGVPIPLVRLGLDICDRFASDQDGCSESLDSGPTLGFGGTPGPTGLYLNRTMNQTLTDAQEAILGCGFFWGTSLDSDCEFDGVRLLRSEASALLEAMLRPSDWVATNGLPQPGTVGYVGEVACERETASGSVRLPGCRGPADPGYDPLIDGCTGPGPFGCNAGDGGRLADADLLAIPPPTYHFPDGFGASIGQVFRSEMSALSWNLTMTLVVSSRAPFGSSPPNAFDSANAYSAEPGKCSFAQPQHCYAVAAFSAALALEDDPAPAPRRRWGWENGAEWRIDSATGDFAPFAGGTIQQYGPIVPQTLDADASIGFMLAPEPGDLSLGVAATIMLYVLVARRSPVHSTDPSSNDAD